ncbi:MAG: hypothetical protein ACKVS6_13860 [Planctomycetota bacterium]
MNANAQEITDHALAGFVESARNCFGENLVSILLFGSAAENKQRATSDTNIFIVLREFQFQQSEAFRETLQISEITIRARAMILLEREVAPASLAFADKFKDILRRRRVIYGTDALANITIPRDALVHRLRQSLLNLTVRLREHVASEEREATIRAVIADCSGPLRALAANLCDLESLQYSSPKDALEIVTRGSSVNITKTLETISKIREQSPDGPPAGRALLWDVYQIASYLYDRSLKIPGG